MEQHNNSINDKKLQNKDKNFIEDFAKDEKQREDLKKIFQDNKYPIVNKETGEIRGYYLHDSLRDKRNFKKTPKRLTNFIRDTSDCYTYVLNFKDFNVQKAKLENMYDGRKYNSVVSLIEKQINGAFIAVLEYGVENGLHCHIFSGRQNNKLLKSEFLLDTQEKIVKTTKYLSKPVLGNPIHKNNREFRENYEELKEMYQIVGGKIIEFSRMKRRRSAHTVYRTNKKNVRLH